ncbi:TonB-dependent receptor plug domain-containing protein [Permianibacter sp. IMCC34836]|uniref:TonB-dependent receptor plug domain-containing protein n=1 Tax=Permianibacter fluminis TaxID=2738515 RepID=UPI0015558A45|nr:TonB-dependent receptor plug domain-containing protein [Permianibacter fluminis]NQD38986.1 TonB-dependent receptor plug domain-containing protein [Permianibacter fluminis]
MRTTARAAALIVMPMALLMTVLASASVFAADADDLFQLDLDDLLQIDISTSIATRLPLSQRQNPAILSIITAEDIRAMGARDLIDVIQRIPGFNVAKDIDVAGLVVRGLFGFEGRALFLLDGMPLTELAFGAYPLGNDLPVHLIERIEIVRGPGSVLYGGAAETAVINIITYSAGNEARIRDGELPSANGHRDLGARFAGAQGQWRWQGLLFAGDGRRSDAPYRYFNERPAFDHNEASAGIRSRFLSSQLHWGPDWSAKLLWQHYENNIVRGFAVDDSLPPVEQAAAIEQGIAANFSPLRFDNAVLELDGRIYTSENFRSDIQTSLQRNIPFERPSRDDVGIRRLKLTSNNVWSFGSQQWLLGAEWLQDDARILRTADPAERDPDLVLRADPDDPGSSHVSLDSMALYFNWQQQWDALTVFAGGRYDDSDVYGNQFSPRVGLTWVRDRWHWKLLSQQAFRAPLIANSAFSRFGYDPSKPYREPVTPETIRVHEFELGYLATPQLFLSGNLFYQTVEDIIEFRYNPDADDLYSDNGGKFGSYGAEFEARYQQVPWRLLMNLSYATPKLYDDDNPFAYASDPQGGDTYLALHEPDEWIGIPSLKFFANLQYQWNDRVHLFINMLWLSEKNAAAEQPFGVTDTLPAQTLFDLGLHYDQRAWSLSVTLHDAGNERLNIVTPYYDSTFDTLPYKGRELSLDWRLQF